MSNKITDIIHLLSQISMNREGDAEVQTKFQELVLDAHGGDAGEFIVQLSNLEHGDAIKVLKYLEKYHQWAAAFCLSRSLVTALKLLSKIEGDEKNQLKILILELLKKGVSEIDVDRLSNENLLTIGEYSSLTVPHDDLEISNSGCVIIEKLLHVHHSELVQSVYTFSQQFLNNTTVYLRFITVFIRAASHSEEFFSTCDSLGVVTALVQLCRGNDILLQINALELLKDVASTQAGLDYLCEHKVVQWLINASCGHPGAASDPLIASEAMRTLGEVFAHASAKSFNFVGKVDVGAIHHFLSTLVRFLEENDEANRIAALGIVSQFATVSFSTLNAVAHHAGGRLVAEWLDQLNAAKPELIAAALHSVARVLNHDEKHFVVNNNATFHVFRSPPSSAADSKSTQSHSAESKTDLEVAAAVVSIKKNLLQEISTAKRLHIVTYLLKVVKLPVPSVRCAGMDLLAAIAAQSNGWGLLLLSGPHEQHAEGDFLAWLANRESEYSMEGKEWKFAVISAAANNLNRQLLGAAFNATIEKLEKQGPHYMPARVADMLTI